MQLVRFTKFWEDLSARQLGERASELGFDGLDLAVRDGHAINADNVTDELPGAVRAWRELGVDCSMISSSTDLIDPEAADAVTLFEAAAAAGVPRIKMGYFKFNQGDSFEELWSLARRRLDGFERLSRRTGVQTMYHTHSGQCLGSNCAGMRHLLQDYDPRQVGAYVDLGHLAINGEDVQIGLAMLRDRLSAIGGKDARHFPDERPDRRARFADGFVLARTRRRRVARSDHAAQSLGFQRSHYRSHRIHDRSGGHWHRRRRRIHPRSHRPSRARRSRGPGLSARPAELVGFESLARQRITVGTLSGASLRLSACESRTGECSRPSSPESAPPPEPAPPASDQTDPCAATADSPPARRGRPLWATR